MKFLNGFFKKLAYNMGCVYSSQFKQHHSSKLFQVWNIDENGRILKCGKIEVTDTDLILHQKHKPAIQWPLRCLRRYGFDAEMFSFESGRRCPTGEGIYAFRCYQSEALFNLLQESIQKNGPPLSSSEDHSSGLSLLNSSPSSSPTNPEVEYPPQPQGSCGCCNMLSCGRSSSPPLYMNEPQYINSKPCLCGSPPTTSPTCVDHNTNYARLDYLIKLEHKPCLYYMNLQGSTMPSSRCYANIGADANNSSSSQAAKQSLGGPPSPHHPQTLPSLAPLVYIQLDLDNQPSSPPSTSPAAHKDGYVTIDFDKTIALSQTIQPGSVQDDSVRKTRHSSTIIPHLSGQS